MENNFDPSFVCLMTLFHTAQLGTTTICFYILDRGVLGFTPAEESDHQGGNQICKNIDGTLPSLNSTKRVLELLGTRSLFGVTVWIGSVGEKEIINGMFDSQAKK